jgi:predicted ATPase/DNA-binding SARP family transcriptional activator
MEFRVLGPLEVVQDGRPLQVKGRQRRLLLATLLLHRNEVVSVAHLVDVLFGDDPPDRGAGTVQSYVSRLRQDFGGDRTLQTHAPGYLLVAAPDRLDATRFEHAVAKVAALVDTDPVQSAALLSDALSWWRGPAYAEFVDDLALGAERTRLDEARQTALEMLVDARLAVSDTAGAISLLETCVAEQPLRERFRAQHMVALYRSGRHAEALRAFQRFQSELSSELGLQPSSALARLELRILQQDPSLDLQRAGFEPVAAPRTPVAGRSQVQLPLPLHALVGRDADLADLGEILTRCRMLTLTGPGGVGKTRLALRLAEDNDDRFPDGVWFCDLAAVREPAQAIDAITTAVDVQRRQDRSTLESLVEVLEPRNLLILFDNCEHLLAAIGDVAEAVLHTCPDVTIVATSREPLGVDGEHVWAVRPLDVPDSTGSDPTTSLTWPSVRLFVDRATSAQPQFRLTAMTVPSVIEVCRRLDGLPLALELAAARVRSMTVADVAAGLDERFTLLTSGRRAEPRHQTLLATVEWSYHLLDPPEQVLFSRLAVFAGAFMLDDVEQVCADEIMSASEIRACLLALVDKSMVLADTTGISARYSLLETLRQFGRQRVQVDGLAEALELRHGQHYVTVVERAEKEMGGPGEVTWSIRIDAAFDDLRLAHRRALARGDVDTAVRLVAGAREFALRSMRYELFTWAETVLSSGVDDAAHPLIPTVLAIASYGRFVRGELDAAVEMADRSLAVESRAGQPPSGLNLRTLGNVFYYRGRTEDAARACERMTRAARDSGDDARLVHALYMSSVGLASAGRAEESRLLAEEALSLARRIDNPTSVASALYAQAMTCVSLDPGRAASMLEEASEQGARVGNRWMVAFARTELVSLAARRGDLDEALRLADAVIDIWYRGGDWANQWLTLRHVAGVFAQRGDHVRAATLHGALRVASAEHALPIEASDMRRLAGIREFLPDALGPTALADAEAVGASMPGDAVVRYTREAIADVLG